MSKYFILFKISIPNLLIVLILTVDLFSPDDRFNFRQKLESTSIMFMVYGLMIEIIIGLFIGFFAGVTTGAVRGPLRGILAGVLAGSLAGFLPIVAIALMSYTNNLYIYILLNIALMSLVIINIRITNIKGKEERLKLYEDKYLILNAIYLYIQIYISIMFLWGIYLFYF